MSKESTLEIRKVTVTYIGRDTALISDGLEAGEHLITTRLRAAVDGMKVRVEDAAPDTE